MASHSKHSARSDGEVSNREEVVAESLKKEASELANGLQDVQVADRAESQPTREEHLALRRQVKEANRQVAELRSENADLKSGLKDLRETLLAELAELKAEKRKAAKSVSTISSSSRGSDGSESGDEAQKRRSRNQRRKAAKQQRAASQERISREHQQLLEEAAAENARRAAELKAAADRDAARERVRAELGMQVANAAQQGGAVAAPAAAATPVAAPSQVANSRGTAPEVGAPAAAAGAPAGIPTPPLQQAAVSAGRPTALPRHVSPPRQCDMPWLTPEEQHATSILVRPFWRFANMMHASSAEEVVQIAWPYAQEELRNQGVTISVQSEALRAWALAETRRALQDLRSAHQRAQQGAGPSTQGPPQAQNHLQAAQRANHPAQPGAPMAPPAPPPPQPQLPTNMTHMFVPGMHPPPSNNGPQHTHAERLKTRPPINCRDCGLLVRDIREHKSSGNCEKVQELAGRPPKTNHNDRNGGGRGRGGGGMRGRFGAGRGGIGGRGRGGHGGQYADDMHE